MVEMIDFESSEHSTDPIFSKSASTSEALAGVDRFVPARSLSEAVDDDDEETVVDGVIRAVGATVGVTCPIAATGVLCVPMQRKKTIASPANDKPLRWPHRVVGGIAATQAAETKKSTHWKCSIEGA